MTCEEAGRLGAEKRRQLEREPIRRKCNQLLAEMGKLPDPRLMPPLLLSKADQLWAR